MKITLDSKLEDILLFYRENEATIGKIVASKGLAHPKTWGEVNAARKVECAAVIILAGLHYCKELGSVVRAALEADDHAVPEDAPVWSISIVDACLNLAKTGYIG